MSERIALILYGPPASGKNAVTEELIRRGRRFILHQRMKVGTGNATGYRMGTAGELQRLRAAGQVLYENARYDNVYAFVAEDLERDLARGIPVLHVGQVAGGVALKAYSARWISVALWCGREDVERRLVAWDETEADYATARGGEFDVVLGTDELTVGEVVGRILGMIANSY